MQATLALLLALAAPSGRPGHPPAPPGLARLARHPADEARLLASIARNPTGANPGWGKGWSHVARFGGGGGTNGLGFASPEGQLAAQKLGQEKAKEYEAKIRANNGPLVKQLQLAITPK